MYLTRSSVPLSRLYILTTSIFINKTLRYISFEYRINEEKFDEKKGKVLIKRCVIV